VRARARASRGSRPTAVVSRSDAALSARAAASTSSPQSWCRCDGRESSPGADVAGVSPAFSVAEPSRAHAAVWTTRSKSLGSIPCVLRTTAPSQPLSPPATSATPSAGAPVVVGRSGTTRCNINQHVATYECQPANAPKSRRRPGAASARGCGDVSARMRAPLRRRTNRMQHAVLRCNVLYYE
jgi:hypothetical protein